MMKNNLTYLGLIGLLIVVIVFGALYSIDLKNMEEGKPVLFSTWGKKYSPVEDSDVVEIRKAINNYIVSQQEETSKSANEKWFCADKTYMISKNDDVFVAYSWICASGYINRYNGELLEGSSFSMPHKFILVKSNDVFEVTEVIIPGDGALYLEDLKTHFPEKVVNDILKADTDGTVDQLQIDIQNQIAQIHK